MRLPPAAAASAANGGAHGAEGGVITLSKDDIILDNGAKRVAPTPKFRLSGEIAASKFGSRQHVTEIATKSLGSEDFSGSVISVGKLIPVRRDTGAHSVQAAFFRPVISLERPFAFSFVRRTSSVIMRK
jgi:hypothetical protein